MRRRHVLILYSERNRRANRIDIIVSYAITLASKQPPGVVRMATQSTKGCSELLMSTSRSVFAELYLEIIN